MTNPFAPHVSVVRRRRPIWCALLGVLALLPVTVFASPAYAGSIIHVTTTAQKISGTGGCSLQEAIYAANLDQSIAPEPGSPGSFITTECTAGDGADTIALAPSAVYTMSFALDDDGRNYVGATATPMVTSAIIIEGSGARLQHAPNGVYFRAFAVTSGGNLTLREVHVKGFAVKGGDGGGGGGGGLGAGGAIYVHESALTIEQSTFEANGAIGGNGSSIVGGAGGGGGGLGGNGGHPYGGAPFVPGGGGGGSRGDGASVENTGFAPIAGGGGGTVSAAVGSSGGFRCGGGGGSAGTIGGADGHDASCLGGGGGGGDSESGITVPSGDGGDGFYGGGGGGGGYSAGDGGWGGFGGGGGAGPSFPTNDGYVGGSGGRGGFGAGGGAGPGGTLFGGPGDGGAFGGDAGDNHGGGGGALGGAIFGNVAAVTVRNSTFTRNFVARGLAGGTGARQGQDAGGAIFLVEGSLTVLNSTVSGNESTGDGAGVVVSRALLGASLTLRNTIVAGNTGRDECFVLSGVAVAGTANLIAPHVNDARPPCPGITQTADPQLGPLQLNYPGRTPTMAIPLTSPALDAADPATSLQTSQNLVLRPQINGYDIGAYEALPADTTAPIASPTQSPPANANGWNSGDVTVTWNWADNAGGSGIDPANCTTSTTSSGEGTAIVLTATCKDLAGNTGSASYTVKVDKTAPAVTCSAAPAYVLGGSHVTDVSATVTDALSGPVASPVAADVTATDVATPGVKSKSLTGLDRAGNHTTVACTYIVAFNFLGFLEPIPQASYKRGATIPVRFRLGDATGAPLADADAQALLAPVCLVKVTLDGVAKGCATYDPASNTFQYDLKTPKTLPLGNHTVGIRVRAPDGTGIVNTNSTTVAIKR